MDSVRACSWPLQRLGEAIEAVGQESGLLARAARSDDALGDPPADGVRDGADSDSGDGDARLESWVVTAAARLGLEAEPVDVPIPKSRGWCARALLRSSACGTRRRRAFWRYSLAGEAS